jgi:hypothetical protein
MGWDVLKVINRGNASGAAFQTGMCGDIFDRMGQKIGQAYRLRRNRGRHSQQVPMGWDVLKVINRGNASGAAFQTGMCGDIFDQFTSYPDAAPIPEAFEKFFSSTYRHFPKLSPNLYQK